MTITLNHTIVPARDKVAAARFFARIFDLSFDGSSDHFAPVRLKGSAPQGAIVDARVTAATEEHLIAA